MVQGIVRHWCQGNNNFGFFQKIKVIKKRLEDETIYELQSDTVFMFLTYENRTYIKKEFDLIHSFNLIYRKQNVKFTKIELIDYLSE